MIASRPLFRIPLPGDRVLELGERTLVMAIINVTPDSFADAGVRFDPDVAIRDGVRFVEDGADILDVGGESTRPGAVPVAAEDELRRVLPVIEGLRRHVGVPISIDTYKAIVAERALDAGASIVNDVSALTYEPRLADVVAARRAAIVLMHNRGRSADMYRLAQYDDVVFEVRTELHATIARAEAAGIDREQIIVDPGLGFAKRAEHTFEVLARLDEIARVGRPILAGPSRKSFLKRPLGDVPPEQRDWGTAATVATAALLGAHIVRVHDVRGMVDVVRTVDEIVSRFRPSDSAVSAS